MKKGAKKWIAFDFEPSPNPKSSPKNSNISEKCIARTAGEDFNIKNVKNKRSSNKRISFNFLEKLKPKTVEDLAVHPKKVKEVELWLQQNVVTPLNIPYSPILLLTGPTGAGKTATVDVLCKLMNIKINEWVNPMDQNFEYGTGQAQTTRFLDFFTQAKYASLCEDPTNKKVALVEDFPNFVTYNSNEFVGILEKCHTGNCPVIFICTDASNSKLDLCKSLFPQESREKFHITNISFNPCSATLLKNLLKKAHSITQNQPDILQTLSSDVIEAIIISTMGDIRCAINQYNFASLKGAGDIAMVKTDLNQSRGKKRKRNEKSSTIKSMSKDETLGFFHGLGRVLNPKRTAVKDSWRLQYDFDTLIDQFSTQPSNFNNFLQENYLNYFGDLSDAQKGADILSQAQLFLSNWTDRHDTLLYALWVAVLGLMVFNEHKVSRWNQIKAPTKSKRVIDCNLETRHLSRTDSLYYNIITKSDKFHTFK